MLGMMQGKKTEDGMIKIESYTDKHRRIQEYPVFEDIEATVVKPDDVISGFYILVPTEDLEEKA